MDKKHAVVIGSGFGGLAAAIRLGARGYQVTVLEKLDAPGGRAYVYRQDGFTFDAGPTVVTAPQLLEELWALCGKKMSDHVELRPVTPFYRVVFSDGDHFEYGGDHALMREQIARLHPDDVSGYEEFLAFSQRLFKIGFEELAHVPFGSWGSMLKVAPDMVKLESYRSVYGLVSKFVKNDKLRQVLSFHTLLVGGNPFDTSSIYAMIAYLERKWGVTFCMGGTGKLVQGLVDLIEGQGNTVRCNAEVRQILVSTGRAVGVELEGGERIRADIVVSNADSAFTYRSLVPPEHRHVWTDKKVERARYSMGLFVWYFGTNRPYDDVKHHTILLGPRYRGLLDDIFKHKVLADDFSLYLHRPGATDKSMAPPGHEAFYVLSPVPHMESRIDWEREAEPYRRKIQAVLEKMVLPDLGKHVVTSRILHPGLFEDRLNSYRGAAFGLEPTLFQSAFFRPHNKSQDVDRLYLVGAGTHPGAGVPGVVSSARVLDTVVPDPAAL